MTVAKRQSTEIIVNPTAGRGQAGKSIAEIKRLLGLAASEWTWRFTQAAGDAERMARAAAARGAPMVVAVGGDGTLHEVANGILGSKTILGLIPFGTGNDLARGLGLFGNLETACRAVTEGVIRPIDVGVIDGAGTNGPRHFLVVSGTGYVAHTARTVNQGIRYLSGAPAYVWGAILTLRTFEPFHLILEMDENERIETEAMFVAVANTAMTGGGMLIAPGAEVDDGLLDICLVKKVSKPQLLYQLTQVLQGTHIKHPAVSIHRTTKLSIIADPPQPLWFDGEVLGTTPASITLLPRALPIKVPLP